MTAALLAAAAHVLAMCAVGYLILAGYRSIHRRSTVMATIVAITILGRLTVGLGLFVISYLGLPFAQSLQGNFGFWMFAQDAAGYYQFAAQAVNAHRLVPLDYSVPSPVYVNALALWMTAVGTAALAAVFLNLCLYVVLAVLLTLSFAPVNDWRRDFPGIVGLAAYSFSPVILFHSTQPLKDELSGFFVVMALLAVMALRPAARQWRAASDGWVLLGCAATIGFATFGIAGIRWYYAFILWGALGVTLTAFATYGRQAPLLRYSAVSLVILMSSWIGFWAGAGVFYHSVIPERVAFLVQLPSDLSVMTQLGRAGFLSSGGDTNVIIPVGADADAGQAHAAQLSLQQHATLMARSRIRPEPEANASPAAEPITIGPLGEIGTPRRRRPAVPAPAPGETTAAAAAAQAPGQSAQAPAPAQPALPSEEDEFARRAIPVTIPQQIKAVINGLAVVFVPIGVLRTFGGIQVSGGRGFLSIVDLDTLFLDVTTLVVMTLLWRRRHDAGDRLPAIVFGLVLAGVSAVMVGYVVSNFGTLWRMRTLVSVPLWVLVIALSPKARTPASVQT